MRSRLHRVLLLLSALTFALVLTTWLVTGAHRGWTRTEITTMEHDAITGLDYPVHRSGFVAGVDFLGSGVAFAAAFAVAGLLIRRRVSRNST